MNTEELIDSLKRDLTPVTRPWPLASVLSLWLLASVAYVVTVTLLLGPFRPGALEQLASHPRFALEMAFGIGAVLSFTVVALSESIPGRLASTARQLGWLLAIGWLLHFVGGFQFPVLEPSMLGKREACVLEAYLYSVPPTIGLIWLQRARFPLTPVRSAIYAALAAGLIPALMMQVACMYEPSHILQFHVAPVGILAVVVGIVMRFIPPPDRG